MRALVHAVFCVGTGVVRRTLRSAALVVRTAPRPELSRIADELRLNCGGIVWESPAGHCWVLRFHCQEPLPPGLRDGLFRAVSPFRPCCPIHGNRRARATQAPHTACSSHMMRTAPLVLHAAPPAGAFHASIPCRRPTTSPRPRPV